MNSTISAVSNQRHPARGIPRHVLIRAILTIAVSALLTGGLFSLFYIAVFNAPEPHDLPMAVTGIDAAKIQAAAGDGYDIVSARDQQAGLDWLARHDVYGMIAIDAARRQVELSYTSVDGSAVLAYMQPIAQKIAEKADMSLLVTNATPQVAANASPGRSVFFAVFGTALTGFVLSQALLSVGKQLRLPLRIRLGIMAGVSIVAGLIVSIMLDPWYQIAPGAFWQTWPMVSLLCLSAVTTGTALLDLVGPFGQVITAVLFVTLGNATATGILPMPFLTPPYQAISRLLPTGNVVRAVMGESYFQGNGQLLGYLVPAIWSAASVAALIVVDAVRDRHSRPIDTAE